MKLDKLPLCLAIMSSLIAIVLFYPRIYFDYMVFVIFGDNMHSFIKYILLPCWPYYLFPLIIIVSTITRNTLYLLLTVFFLPYVFHNQLRFIIEVYTDSTVISMAHSLLISWATVVMVFLALSSGIITLYRLKR